MKVYEAPEYVPLPNTTLFLGGGITNCPDWQADALERLERFETLTVYNPRRADFPMGDPDAAVEQIHWEHDMLKRADIIAFWFPRETLCPITLYELGTWTKDETKEIIVGCDSGYARLLDVQIQTDLIRPEIHVATRFDEFMWQIEVSIP